MNGTTFNSGAGLPGVGGTDWDLEGVGDLTGDGKPDLVWRNTTTGENAVWQMNGLTVDPYADPTAPDTAYRIAGPDS